MRRKLSTQLSVGFVSIVLITISIISLTANILINKQFKRYVAEQQKNFSEEIADHLAPQYDSSTGEWNLDYIHGFGMYALNDGYIIKLYDTEGDVVWDAQNHDMSLCHSIMQEISARMEENLPELDGDFLTYSYNLNQNGTIVGYLEVSYYSPYYFTENDFQFLKALNQILIIIGIVSIIGAAVAGVVLAMRLSSPIAKTTEVTRAISEGNYSIRFESDVRTKELAELSEAVNHMAEGLEKQEVMRRRLTSDVAHELRTPIANVSAHLEAIIEGVWDPTPERLRSYYDELGRLSNIVDELEQLSRIESENMSLHKELVDLLELAGAACTTFEAELAKKRISCTVAGEAVVVMGDRKRLYQVIINLISNAVKYSAECKRIQIRVQDRGKDAELIVEDEGIGIAEKDLPLIFERFYRTDYSRNRKTGGAGIGLAIVKAIVQAHEGKVEVESEEGRGSIFIITLPKESA